MKQYNYLVVFAHGECNYCSTLTTLTHKLNNFDRINELCKQMCNNYNMENVAILNFQLVNVSRVKKEKKKNAKKSD